MEGSMYEVGTPPPHDLGTLHGLVDCNTHTDEVTCILSGQNGKI